MKKVCVTMIFGDYDDLKEPTFVNPDWKYIVFSDRHHKSKVWKTKILKDCKELSDKRKAGYILTQIHKLIDYDICLMVGGQIQINTDLNKYIFDEDFVTLDHPSRNCIYKEAQACILLDKDDSKIIANQMYTYLHHSLPVDVGMIQTGVTIRRNSALIIDFCDSWWLQIKHFSHRDQLSFNYVKFVEPGITHKTISSDLLKREFKLNRHKNQKS